MTDEFHKPTQYSGDKFDTYEGGEDPAQIMRPFVRMRESADALAQAMDGVVTDDNGAVLPPGCDGCDWLRAGAAL